MSKTSTARVALTTVAIGGALLTATLSLEPALGAKTAATATSVTVTAGKPSEFRFTLSKKTFNHGAVVFHVTNKGNLPHDFKICASAKGGLKNTCTGKTTKLLSHGQSATLSYTFKTKGTYEYLCTVAGHAAAGMKGDLKVT
jgi:uncharacterized cupredoxin-like copper-binding protein